MTIKNWKIFNTFKKRKTEDDVIFFPNSQDVFAEKDMEIYFSPLLTYKYKLNNKEYKIHLITTAGLICENDYLNSENRFSNFKKMHYFSCFLIVIFFHFIRIKIFYIIA